MCIYVIKNNHISGNLLYGLIDVFLLDLDKLEQNQQEKCFFKNNLCFYF